MTKKQEVLSQLKNTYCRLKPSKIEGVGVFAIRDIPEGVNPFGEASPKIWHEFQKEELKDLAPEIMELLDVFYVVEKDGSVYIPEKALNGIDISFFVNNSENPNIKTIDGGLNFVTLREIKKGEELVISYATYDDKCK